ncbi:quinone oxidoreductase family protein [Burkholderia oklahomensis]|uniref:quinone oxidoreductase family protein n=1 Tax=Burkholderia oklahomensis TaxID=342113 RepID=UPI0002F8646F|nr:quinone oxidoreductase [Burkholderia oklahomensis]AJX35772.1 zinc-binding dehydrogenase family protein [Burkholderia oklahomensis C6786]AOI50109.1 NADPH:quinone reductase [Burkholderia oklahomensis C6786]KUY50251.1 NADPH:quinone reductase [Burkholderia oklahomensis C6786]MBI0363843.1 quinone oxidoreductase [Burkholderia oklahomensis]SUY27969.1 Quinone oxidoreductase 1 [Burkholderia oklahomensis]
MQAIEIRETGGPDVLNYVTRTPREPGEGELLVELAAAGVNFIDLYRREGRYPMPLPGTPGEEGAGRVLAVGPNVMRFKPGDRVAWTTVMGSYATHVIVPEDKAIVVPDAIDLQTAAAALVQGMTAHYLVNDSYKAREGDTVLVHAAAGGVGLLLTQWLKQRGVQVIGTVSTEQKAALARGNGADDVILHHAVDDLAAEVRRLTGGKGVHAVYDGIGAATFDASLASLRTRGTLVIFGGASGPVPPVDVMRLLWGGSLTLTRPYLEHFRATVDEFLWRAGEVFDGIADGSLEIRIGGSYPLADARRAHADLAARRTTGKLLLVP